MGKRCEFSSRTVITIDTNIQVDEIGVPVEIARGMTIPLTVNESNLHVALELVKRGPQKYPGANYVRNPQGKLFHINKTTLDKHVVEPGSGSFVTFSDAQGWVVERHLVNGDLVAFNRQPSLHRPSIMAHRVRVLHKGKTFRIHSAACNPYNADCDGDEMNMHVPQSMMTEAELITLVALDQHFLSPKSNGPCIGLVQDGITGLFILTRLDVFLDRATAMQIFAQIDAAGEFPPPAILKPKQLWTGKQMFSTILPPNVVFDRKLDFSRFIKLPWRLSTRSGDDDSPEDHGVFKSDDSFCYIRASEMLRGRVDKSVVGSSSNSLLHHIVFYKGGSVAVQFLSAAQKLADAFLHYYGFSVGMSDVMVPEETHREADQVEWVGIHFTI